jgi:hypothetical protein
LFFLVRVGESFDKKLLKVLAAVGFANYKIKEPGISAKVL